MGQGIGEGSAAADMAGGPGERTAQRAARAVGDRGHGDGDR
jgi:hypothetical protein